MTHTRLSPLDASFLAVESPTAHMHVGWVALFEPPDHGITFEALRDHVAARLHRVPRYRQKLRSMPLRLDDPVWIDDENFDVEDHVRRAPGADVSEIADAVFSVPLPRDRPLWELWIADELEGGLIGVVGKVHHCMVDGVAAVELASLLLDPTPDAPPPPAERWDPAAPPRRLDLLAEAVVHLARRQLALAALPARLVGSPRAAAAVLERSSRALRALGDSLRPAPSVVGINDPISSERLLTRARRPLSDLRAIAARHGTTINDVVLAICAGAVGRFLEERGELAVRLKAMVPVSLRAEGEGDVLGNQLSCMFVDLPCDVPDPVLRLKDVSLATESCKRAHEAEGAATILSALALVPAPLKRIASRLVTSPRTFNLIVSNVPGPAEPLYMCGCELREAYPVVPLADRHALSIGFTSVRDQGCFGIYADRATLGDAVVLPEDIEEAIDELLHRPASVQPTSPRSPVLA
jgi:diacylglycerol O-acyltransferase / wax synthase